MSLVKSVQGRVPGGDWAAVSRYLEEKFGTRKRSWVKRRVSAAKVMSTDLVSLIEERVAQKGLNHGLKDSCFYDNDFLVGSEAKASARLPESFAISAVQALIHDIDDGYGMTSSTFTSNICKPLKLVSMWTRSREDKFGEICAASPAWLKLKGALQSDRAMRMQVLDCMRRGAQLDDETKGGIVECVVLMKQLAMQKA